MTTPDHIEWTVGRVGDWMQTYTGIHFYPQDPRPEEIDIRDIAHALSLQCRYGGHTPVLYSVAQHSVLVANNLPQELKLWGLLHDASEAYLVDLPRPVKRFSNIGTEYKKVEERLMKVICSKYNLSWPEPPEVKHIDNLVLVTEARDLMGNPSDWTKYGDPLPEVIKPWDSETAWTAFMILAEELGVKL